MEIRALAKLGDIGKTEENAAHVAQLQAKLDDGKARAALYNSREELFEWGITEYPQLGELNRMLEVHLNLWTTAVSFQRAYPVWMDGPFLELSPEQARPHPSSDPIPSPSIALIGRWKTKVTFSSTSIITWLPF